MFKSNNTVGRPRLSTHEIDLIFRKLQPHLEAGLSLNKACIQARVAKSSVYDLGHQNQLFAEKIEAAINHHSILVNDVINKELVRISEKQKTKELNSEELKLIQWIAVTSKSTRDEFDRKFVPEAEREAEVNKKKEAVLNNPEALKAILKVADRVRENLKENIKNPVAEVINP